MPDFEQAFKALTGNPPFPWQQALYDDWFAHGRFPAACDLPTGLGKTSVLAVWLIAQANRPDAVPRRLVYVVNRRTVVDQTTDEAEKYRKQAAAAGLPVPAISTLRGQFADNREWSADPSRPAIICGTVDMIGSRLLFGGYGVGFKPRPLHAGFLGQDVLLVHDEAHLEPAFQTLLEAIQAEQRRCNEFGKFHVMELSATPRGGGDVHRLSDDDKADPVVSKRLHSPKRIELHAQKDNGKLAEQLTALALAHRESGRAVLVFARSVEDVKKVEEGLNKQKLPVATLTGTMRGREREKLATESAVFARFLPKPPVPATEGTVYLVCTSAGEVGVNISADHLVCDLTPFDSMAQRFGRVNRFGDRDDTRIDIVYSTEFDTAHKTMGEYEARREKTLALIRDRLEGDGSPNKLGKLSPTERQAAFTPTPVILPTSDILFDAWALTTIRDKLPGRPSLEPYLHGVAEWEPPQTQVAWREEVGLIAEGDARDLLSLYPPKELLDDYPLKPHELLQDSTKRVFDELVKLARRAPDAPVWVIDSSEEVTATTLRAVAQGERDELNRKTLLLAPSAGGLSAGGTFNSGSERADDVADELTSVDRQGAVHPRRKRVWDDAPPPDGMRLVRTLDTRPDTEEADADGSPAKRFWHWYERPEGGDTDGSRSARKAVLWQVHTDDVVRELDAFLPRLGLSPALAAAVRVAAVLHDLGKKRRMFQRALGNHNPAVELAKSGKKGGRLAETYRHEFGSLLDAEQHADFLALGAEEKELCLHLIASHHGRGRPHFSREEAFDPERPSADADRLARAVPGRYARLQRKYGRWGLAYLESLLRAADYAASAKPSKFVEDK